MGAAIQLLGPGDAALIKRAEELAAGGGRGPAGRDLAGLAEAAATFERGRVVLEGCRELLESDPDRRARPTGRRCEAALRTAWRALFDMFRDDLAHDAAPLAEPEACAESPKPARAD